VTRRACGLRPRGGRPRARVAAAELGWPAGVLGGPISMAQCHGAATPGNSEQNVQAAADAMVSKGLLAAGYKYLN
jgi:hypothetical protein